MNDFIQFKLRKDITSFAKQLGFDLVGFTKPQLEPKHMEAYKTWLAQKNHGDMSYLENSTHIEARADMQKILPGVQSVIVVAMNYYRPQTPLKRGSARVARYAYGRDYHKIMGTKLRKLRQYITGLAAELLPNEKVAMKSFVDVGPILERAYAQQAGLGVVGKNSLLITKDFGSWVVLGEVLTTLPLAIEVVAVQSTAHSSAQPKAAFSSCGSCTRCMQACPTGAIIAPGVIDARLCISYLTIEHEGRVPAKLAATIKKTKKIFGCDICQEVCPHNTSRQTQTTNVEWTDPKLAGDALHLTTLKKIKTDSLFHVKYAGSALKRPARSGVQRIAKIIQP